MSVLMSLLRAAHCRSTHHYFALDALNYVDTEQGHLLSRLLLRHHEKYFAGAKAPDDRFRDFQNHIVHVREGYWGGAPRLAVIWYDRLKEYLVSDRYGDAAFAAGVLSHYFTDPLQPLHTGQTEREPLVHRAMEWSIRCCYDEILEIWVSDERRVVFQLGDREGWLAEAIFKGARFANYGYDRLVATYDLERGSKDPKAGLDANARQTFASLFGLAITGLARIWERVAEEVTAERGSPLPNVTLCGVTFLSALQIPEKLLLRRIQNYRERTEVARVLAEFQRTGRLVENLPAECFVKQQVWLVRQRELTWQGEQFANEPIASEPSINDQHSADQAVIPIARPTIVGPSHTGTGRPSSNPPVKRFRLNRQSDLVDAPSIGPKTAARFYSISICSVGEFLDQDAHWLSTRLEVRWITPRVIADWQAQARLMCEIPGLLARDTQVLVGVGYRSPGSLIGLDPHDLKRKIDNFALTNEGKRALRHGPAPDLKTVCEWVTFCQPSEQQYRAAS